MAAGPAEKLYGRESEIDCLLSDFNRVMTDGTPALVLVSGYAGVGKSSVVHEPFPAADPALLVDDTVTCVVQVLGKVRDRLEVAADISEADLQAAALASERIQGLLEGKTIRKVIVRAPKLVNIVVG